MNIEKAKNKNFFKNILFLITSIALFIFIVIAIFIFSIQRNKLFSDVDSQMMKNLTGIIISLKIDLNKLEEKNEIAINTFKVYLSTNRSYFSFSDENFEIDASNYESGIEQNITLKKWYYRDKELYNNPDFFNSIAISLKNDLVIAQKTKDGYVTIVSTNNLYENVIFPYSTNLVYSIENGETYKDIVNIKGENYLISATPFYVGSKIEGMLMSIENYNFSKYLHEFIGSQVYYKRGYAFAMNRDGVLVLHPTQPNTSIKNSKLFKRIFDTEKSPLSVKIKYTWPESQEGEHKVMFVQYVPEIKLFVAVSYYISDFRGQLNRLRVILFFAILAAISVFLIFILILSRSFNKVIDATNSFITRISKGDIPEDYKSDDNREILVQNFNNLLKFSESLKKLEFDKKYEPWSNSDKIGQNLVSLSNYLNESQKESETKSEEQKRLIWLNEGISRFIEILKYQVIEINELTYKIISHLVEYIGANEGGFFIVNIDDNENKFLELYAAYSMHKKKLIDRKVEFGVGLVGRVAVEKKYLFIKDVPDSYAKISTALGEGKPACIVVVPLLFNEDIIGVIELTSFKIISDLQMEFIERISENISANLAMWQANQRTADLLRNSQEQAQKQQEQQKTLQKHLKDLEKLKEQSEQRELELNSIIKAVDTTALLVEYDSEGKITNANSRFTETLGKKLDELLGKHHRDITSMDVKSSDYIFFWKDLLEAKTKRFIESFTIGENVIWLSQNYVPILDKNGNVFKILNIAIDITENKVLERQLREQVKEISKEARNVRKEERKVKQEREEFLERENVYKSTINGVDKFFARVEISLDSKIINCNSIFAEFLSFDQKMLIEKNIKDFISKEDYEKFSLVLESAKKGEEYTSVITFIDQKNNQILMKYTIQPVPNIKNKIEKIILLATKQ